MMKKIAVQPIRVAAERHGVTIMDNQTKKDQENKETNSSPMTPKRIAAIIGVVLLVLLYLIALLVAIFDRSSSLKMVGICLVATMVIPLMIWIYTWMYGKMTGKNTFANFTPRTPSESEESSSDQDTSK